MLVVMLISVIMLALMLLFYGGLCQKEAIMLAVVLNFSKNIILVTLHFHVRFCLFLARFPLRFRCFARDHYL